MSWLFVTNSREMDGFFEKKAVSSDSTQGIGDKISERPMSYL